jgi:spermidine synthase
MSKHLVISSLPHMTPAVMKQGLLKALTCAGVFAVVVMACFLAWNVPQVPWQLVAYGRYLPTKSQSALNLYTGEGLNASVAVTELTNGVRNFHVSGKVEASTDPRDMGLQRMLGHLPALLHENPHSVLIVGCGAGITAGSFLVHPEITNVVICEIESLIPKVVAQFFGEENYDLMQDARVRVVYDDARHFILTSRERFDIITSDPIHPWVKGAATLYTREYFDLCRKRLNPGGMVTQWVPLYESNLAVVKSELATFFDVFAEGTIWSNDDAGDGYDMVLLGHRDAPEINVDRVQQRLSQEKYAPVLKSLRDAGFRSGFSLLATYTGFAPDLQTWLEGAQLNRDRNLRLQYLAGMGLNYSEQDLIYTDLLLYRRFPKDLFVGSSTQKEALMQLVNRSHPK